LEVEGEQHTQPGPQAVHNVNQPFTLQCQACLHQRRIKAAVREGSDGAWRVKAADPHAQLAAVLSNLAVV